MERPLLILRNRSPLAAITTRSAGSMRADPSPVELAARELGLHRKPLLRLRQTHSRRVVAFHAGNGMAMPGTVHLGEGDGLVTDDPSVVLTCTVADCMPIYIHDREGPVMGLLHSGRKGTGILADAVRTIRDEFAVPPQRLSVLFGPCIGVCCYEVDPDCRRDFCRRWGQSAGQERDGRHYIDLVEANLALATSLGIQEVRLESVCTVCNDWLGSYRREGSDGYTLMLAVAANP